MASPQTPDRPYQGYPYINPVVIDVPSVDAATAARWANLPKRRINNPVVKDQTGTVSGQTSAESPSDVPGPKKMEEQDVPVVYIDLPEETGSAIPRPVLATPAEPGRENPAFGETIFFDPFENRQIDMNRNKETSEREEARPVVPRPTRPAPSPATTERPYRPPTTLILTPVYGQSSSSIPGSKNNEAQVYGSSPSSDGFSLTPLPVSDYPEPPPAYSELGSGEAPPRTQVIVSPGTDGPTVGLPSSFRKTVHCQQCGLRVNTLMVRENGMFTHCLAMLTILCCIFPVTFAVYWTNCFKNKVHYCPNCNYKIGHQLPMVGKDIIYRQPTTTPSRRCCI